MCYIVRMVTLDGFPTPRNNFVPEENLFRKKLGSNTFQMVPLSITKVRAVMVHRAPEMSLCAIYIVRMTTLDGFPTPRNNFVPEENLFRKNLGSDTFQMVPLLITKVRAVMVHRAPEMSLCTI